MIRYQKLSAKDAFLLVTDVQTLTFGDPMGEQSGDGLELRKPSAHGRSKTNELDIRHHRRVLSLSERPSDK